MKSSSGTPKKVAVAPPDAFLQSLQWQVAIKFGSVLNSNFTAPQAHWAVYFLVMSSPFSLELCLIACRASSRSYASAMPLAVLLPKQPFRS
jgi:hypothetical protein